MDDIEKFLKYIKEEKNYSDLTIESYKNDLEEFLVCINAKDLSKVNRLDIKIFLKELFDKNDSANTVSRKISTLKSFYKYMKIIGNIDSNPMSSIKYPKKEKPLPKFVQ